MVSKSNCMGGALGSGLAVALLWLGACGTEGPDLPERRAAPSSAATTVVACSPVAAHPKHAAASCATCHLCRGAGPDESGGVAFDPAGLAVAPGQPVPAFDKSSKSCANAACHGVPAGTFSYYFPGGDGEPELRTFGYGSAPRPTPSWLTTGLRCDGCHGNPPRNAVWHSGYHAGQGPTGAANQCQFCHPDATGSSGAGTAITNAALHGNRSVEVAARFRSSCFSCH